MRAFSSLGVFINPRDPQERISGELAFDPQAGIRLRLNGAFGDASRLLQSESLEYPTIRGMLAKSPYGRHTILLDSFLTKSSLSFAGTGLASAEYRANRLVLSHDELDDPNREFPQVCFRLTHLPAWWPSAGMRTNIDETGAVSIVCAGPETWKANTDVGTVELRRWWRCEADAITGTSVAPQCWVYVRLSQGQSIGQLQADVVRPIQNLLTFLTDRPNGICDLSFSDRSAPALAADEPLGYTLIYAPTPVVAPPDNILLPDDVLVHAKDIDDFQQMIRKWFRFAADYPSFIARLFTLIEQPSPFVERRFLESVHLAGLYYLGTARNGRRDQLCAAIREALDASGLEGVAVGAVEAAAIKVGAWKWLTVLMQDAREVTVAVVGPHADQFLGRVQQITATLELGCERGACVDNAELYWTNEKLLGLLKTAVLGELGFERSAQLGLLRRNRRIRFTAAK